MAMTPLAGGDGGGDGPIPCVALKQDPTDFPCLGGMDSISPACAHIPWGGGSIYLCGSYVSDISQILSTAPCTLSACAHLYSSVAGLGLKESDWQKTQVPSSPSYP
jgi:hypothetical protein